MSKYMIIGGSGFIGQSICNKLKKNFLILDNTKPKKYKNFFLKCDVNNIHSLQKNICSNARKRSNSNVRTYVQTK